MTKRPAKLQRSRSVSSLPRKQAKQFYQTPEWRNFRNDYKKQKRKEHEQIVLKVYHSNPDNDPDDLLAFLNSDNPLSEPDLNKGIIKVANILDHKTRIRKGGAKFAKSNLQWVTESYHNSKSGKEAHE